MKCLICPNDCNVDRTNNFGFCNSSYNFKIAKYAPFFYEEPLVSGQNGSGAIFFTGCSLKCKFCQNYELSRNLRGKEFSFLEFKTIIDNLTNSQVHNINLVNPTHYALGLSEFFKLYPCKIPIVYNTHGYEKLSTLSLVENFVDVYLVDLKYYLPTRSKRYCGKENYFEYASSAILEMVKQKPLIIENGIIKQGVIVRHLILPQNTDESIRLIDWYNQNVGDKAYLSVMSQYTPFGEIDNLTELKRTITDRERNRVYDYVFSLKLQNVFMQEKQSATTSYIPKWDF
ncbi:MAG: 4Fe-4S cluster-binding domain-containing protein [Clostridia bacterium]|nr:4Fe-4S cluster-binding domain-containing protein [Clostridia bacterium]